MKIIVLMKQVANKDAVLRIAGDEKWINEADISQQTNESDGYALEEALRSVEAKGEGEVVVCTLGPQTAKTVINVSNGSMWSPRLLLVDARQNSAAPQANGRHALRQLVDGACHTQPAPPHRH